MTQHVFLHSEPGGEPVEPIDRLPVGARAIADHEREKRAAAYAISSARHEQSNDLQIELAHYQRTAAGVMTHPNATPAEKERAQKPVEKTKAKLAALQAKAATGGSNSQDETITEFQREFRVGGMYPHTKWRDANTTAELETGQTPKEAFDHAKSMTAQAKVNRSIVNKRPPSRDAIESKISHDVDALAGKIGLGGVKHVDSSGRRFKQNNIFWPTTTKWAGDAVKDVPDALAILFDIFGAQIKTVLIARALENFDARESLTDLQRIEALAQADAEILKWERLSEFWLRRCEAAGIDPGPRHGVNPLAILDIEPA